MDAVAPLKAVAIDLAALGDTDALWNDWLTDAGRRARVDVRALDDELPNWRRLLERFAEERAPVYLRRDAEATAAVRRLRAAGWRVGIFSAAPEELTRVALSQLGATRHAEVVESGDGALDRVLAELGSRARVVRTREDLLGLR